MRIVILAGGGGSRMWPMSRSDKPKQFCNLISEKTMLEDTLTRFSDYSEDKLFISTTAKLFPKVKKLLPLFREENIIVEPAQKDTAPAMGYVAFRLGILDKDEPLAFIPSDHYIGRTDIFLKSIKEAEKVIKETGKLLDISVHPTIPTTTLGYTEIGKKKFERNGIEFFEFLGHVEKPSYKIAQQYLEEGNYLWHANYYMWTPRLFLEAYKKYAPEIFEKLLKIGKLVKNGEEDKIERIYCEMEKISIDYAITEKMDPEELLIIKGAFEWKDIGAWDTLHENLITKTDERRNLVKGACLNIDTSNSIIYSKDNKLIATIGVDDLVIIDTDDALLVCPKSRAQDVKKIVEELKKRGGKYI
ncbi:MAG: sugar phosphate nucleotidyltransferase [Patescibacteria group bacterium]|nr:sugar phosphate nucleotidyltransferase [Patescibacteria group bacterium]